LQHAKAADSLEKTLANRPSVEELKQKHIVVTPIQAKQEALQHAKAADSLERTLANRPSVEELKQKNIVVTPLQAKSQALQHAKAADSLEKTLANRPSVEELKQKHIVVTPVQAKAHALQRAQVADILEKSLAKVTHAPDASPSDRFLLFWVFDMLVYSFIIAVTALALCKYLLLLQPAFKRTGLRFHHPRDPPSLALLLPTLLLCTLPPSPHPKLHPKAEANQPGVHLVAGAVVAAAAVVKQLPACQTLTLPSPEWQFMWKALVLMPPPSPFRSPKVLFRLY
jgi:hypothetical protein